MQGILFSTAGIGGFLNDRIQQRVPVRHESLRRLSDDPRWSHRRESVCAVEFGVPNVGVGTDTASAWMKRRARDGGRLGGAGAVSRVRRGFGQKCGGVGLCAIYAARWELSVVVVQIVVRRRARPVERESVVGGRDRSACVERGVHCGASCGASSGANACCTTVASERKVSLSTLTARKSEKGGFGTILLLFA